MDVILTVAVLTTSAWGVIVGVMGYHALRLYEKRESKKLPSLDNGFIDHCFAEYEKEFQIRKKKLKLEPAKEPDQQKYALYFNESRQSLVHDEDFHNGHLVGRLTQKNTRKLKNFIKDNQTSKTEIEKIIQVLNTKSK